METGHTTFLEEQSSDTDLRVSDSPLPDSKGRSYSGMCLHVWLKSGQTYLLSISLLSLC